MALVHFCRNGCGRRPTLASCCKSTIGVIFRHVVGWDNRFFLFRQQLSTGPGTTPLPCNGPRFSISRNFVFLDGTGSGLASSSSADTESGRSNRRSCAAWILALIRQIAWLSCSLALNHILFGKLSGDERSQLFASLIGHPVLSISEGGDQCTVGSLFCLRVGDEQVSFEVNLDSVARSGVRIHPSVLQLSRRRAPEP